MSNPREPTENDKLFFQYYLVVFLDILGQRGSLRNIKGLPTGEKETSEFIEKVKETIGKVENLRTAFSKYFIGAKSFTPDISKVPAEYQQEFLACQKSEAYYYGFSDSIIVAVPLASSDENCSAMNGVFAALTAASGISLLSLSMKMALRGGLDVGIATQISDNEIYGPALERAYHLESNVAQYPRFAIGRELINYLRWVVEQPSTSHASRIAKEIAKMCKEMIWQDTDGVLMLDFCGAKVKEVACNSLNADFVRQAMDFAGTQYQKYSEEENHELAARYFRLLRYLKSRANLWN
jgi:hypothetical protein